MRYYKLSEEWKLLNQKKYQRLKILTDDQIFEEWVLYSGTIELCIKTRTGGLAAPIIANISTDVIEVSRDEWLLQELGKKLER